MRFEAWKKREGVALLKLAEGRDKTRYAFGSLRQRVLTRDNYRCRYCNTELTDTSARLDHVVPWHLGGPTNIGNLVACCDFCNKAKYGSMEVAVELLSAESEDDVDAIMEAFADEWREKPDTEMMEEYDRRLAERNDPDDSWYSRL